MKFNYESTVTFCEVNSLIFMGVCLVSFLFFDESNLNTFLAIMGFFTIVMVLLRLAKLHYIEHKNKQ